jgi:hypothetical protein
VLAINLALRCLVDLDLLCSVVAVSAVLSRFFSPACAGSELNPAASAMQTAISGVFLKLCAITSSQQKI